MKKSVSVLCFSSRAGGNCRNISTFIQDHCGEADVSVYSMDFAPCGGCDYECLKPDMVCPSLSEDYRRLMDKLCDSNLVYFIVPNFCGGPCANYWAFNERTVGYFNLDREKLNRYMNVKKRFIIVSNSEGFEPAMQQQTNEKPEILYLKTGKYGKNSIAGDLLDSEAARADLKTFLGIDMRIQLTPMTLPLLRQFFSGFTPDPDTSLDPVPAVIYDSQYIEHFFEKHDRPDRRHFAIMYENTVIGDLYFKHINEASGSCTLSIHLQCDAYKNRGFGTKAETLALEYAFNTMQMKTVYADALIKNERSCHVLQKVGFTETGRDQERRYFCCQRPE